MVYVHTKECDSFLLALEPSPSPEATVMHEVFPNIYHPTGTALLTWGGYWVLGLLGT